MELKHLTNETFDEAIKGEKTVLVDFFATWCGPCKMLSPVLEGMAEEVKDLATIYKLDIDEGFDVAKRFGVMSVPTMIIFKNGEEKERLVGLRQKMQILEALRKYEN